MQGRLRTPEQGADTIVWLCCAPATKIEPGAFYLDRKPQDKNLSLVGGAHKERDIETLVSELNRLTQSDREANATAA